MGAVKEFISTVFIVDNGKVLLTWNKKCNIWVPVGGHIEANELPCNSVIREAKEESGLDIELVSVNKADTANIAQPAQMNLDHVSEDHKHINLMYFAVVKGGVMMKESDEGTALKWFSKQELEEEGLLPNIKEWAIKAIEHFSNHNS